MKFRSRFQSIDLSARMVSGVLVLNLLIFTFAAWALLESRRGYVERAEQSTQHLALALEREIHGIIRTTDVVLQGVIDEYARLSTQGPIDASRLNGYISQQKNRFPYIDGIRITDANGILRYGTDVSPGAVVDLSDRPHFKSLTYGETGLVVSKPQKSRANGKWVVVFARRINGHGNLFAGMAFIPVAIENLTRTFSVIGIQKNGCISLHDRDLALLARYPTAPTDQELVGYQGVTNEFSNLVTSGATRGTFHAITPLDGVERVFTFNKVGEHPLYLVVGRARDEFLAPWRHATGQAIATVLLLICLTTALSILAYHNWKTLVRANTALDEMAHTDFLTQLMNRRAFLQAAEAEFARSRRYASPLSTLVVDIDHFKQVNDRFGHLVGDQVLQAFSRRFSDLFREIDLVARWGGEEFIVVLPATAAAGAIDLAERVRQAIASSPILDAPSPVLSLTVSIGVATLQERDTKLDDLIQRADEAAYQAKSSGRNQVVGDPVIASAAN